MSEFVVTVLVFALAGWAWSGIQAFCDWRCDRRMARELKRERDKWRRIHAAERRQTPAELAEGNAQALRKLQATAAWLETLH